MNDKICQKVLRSQNMSAIGGKNTQPEILVRKLLHRKGFRFRLHRKDLPGTPDIVLPRYKTVIFVNGCFWHGHRCHLFKWPKTNQGFWKEKILKNISRDECSVNELRESGWRIIVVWECCLKGKQRLSTDHLARLLTAALMGEKELVELTAFSRL